MARERWPEVGAAPGRSAVALVDATAARQEVRRNSLLTTVSREGLASPARGPSTRGASSRGHCGKARR